MLALYGVEGTVREGSGTRSQTGSACGLLQAQGGTQAGIKQRMAVLVIYDGT
jgi:hypothetical protein